MNNLEEDLKQASYAIKALLLQNKSLIKDINTRISENKNLSNELNLKIGENQNLKIKLENDNKNENKMNQIINYDNNNNNDLINVNIDLIKVDDEGEYDEPQIKNINLRSDNNKQMNNNNRREEKRNDYNYEQLANVKNIMKEIRNNKKNLQRIIEEHLKGQNKNDYNSN